MKSSTVLLILLFSITKINLVFAQDQMIVNNTNLNTIKNGEYISVNFINCYNKLRLLVDYGWVFIAKYEFILGSEHKSNGYLFKKFN